MRPHLPRLRAEAERAALFAAFVAGKQREGFRLVHFVVLNDHLHLLVEADSVVALRLGMQGLLIRSARALNRLWRRRGPVFADRFHDRALASPREVRNALVYVFGNARKHAANGRMVKPSIGIDEHASARWFDGFADAECEPLPVDDAAPVVAARTWLLTQGWRRHGRIGVAETPRLEVGAPKPELRAAALDAGARDAPTRCGS